jgi:hypothetical protein
VGVKPLRGVEISGSGWVAGKESGNGLVAVIFPASKRRREGGSWKPNGLEEDPVARSKDSAGSVDPVEAAWKRVVIAGERKAGTRHRFLPGLLAGVLRSGDPQLPKSGWGE